MNNLLFQKIIITQIQYINVQQILVVTFEFTGAARGFLIMFSAARGGKKVGQHCLKASSMAQLLSVVNHISQWMPSNLLRLNPSKKEFIIIKKMWCGPVSITYDSLQSSQPTYLLELFTIQPTRSTRSSSCLTLSQPRSHYPILYPIRDTRAVCVVSLASSILMNIHEHWLQ